jgi:hypothetical protein
LRIVDAAWERRNLGVACLEVTLEAADSAEEVQNTLTRLKTQYLVVKAPAGRADLMFCLSEMRFTFIEASIHMTRRIANLELSGIPKRLADSVSYAPMQETDMQVLCSEIRKGMHDTDRISLDPHFAKQQASNRYIGWITDEVSRGADVYKLMYKKESIGYFAMKDLGGGEYYPFLAGMYQSHRNSGLGFNTAYKAVCEAAARGGTSVSTHVSTNNDSAVRLHLSVGFRFEKITYVYVKHHCAHE